jgi:23S rRNA U2552 (ribose-2'-O)-methylase RlmE/FtsJ
VSSIYKNAWLEVGKEGIGSLKLEHYLPIYDEVFKKYYGKDITYLEIGVSKGGSLATARKVFGKNSTILGCDIVEVKTELDKKGGVNILTSELEKRINAKVINKQMILQ